MGRARRAEDDINLWAMALKAQQKELDADQCVGSVFVDANSHVFVSCRSVDRCLKILEGVRDSAVTLA